ncbi:MAG: phosphatase PAP2 family protein, partial [Acidimicrobiales bacterium]
MSLTDERVRPSTNGSAPEPGRSRWWPEVLYLAVFYVIYRLTHDRGSVAVVQARPVTATGVAGAAVRPSAAARGLRWWREVLYILVFYLVYSAIRNTQGSAAVSVAHAMGNALDIIRLEEVLGLYHEQAIQHAFLGNRLFIEFWNLFYGSFHFVVTTGALILLFRRFPERYRPWRNTLAFTTALALIGFAAYPLMPPRLLPSSYGYVDTLKSYGSLWSFDSGAVNKISNQYAAMPSLHFAWASWSALVLIPAVQSVWAKVLAGIYPFLTLFAIVVTANHFILDAAGGLAVLLVGLAIGFPLAARIERRVATRVGAAGAAGVAGA